MYLPSNEEVPMRTPKEMLEELSKLPTVELKMIVDMHILFRDDAPMEIIKEHHSFQSLAKSVLNQRMGVIENHDEDNLENIAF
jgi:hypothetical protein